MWQQTFRADLYIRDLIRHKLHYFPVPFVVFSQFVLSVEGERLKAALFSASGIRLLIPRKKIISNPAPGFVLTLADSLSSSSVSFWSAQLALGNKIDKGLCSLEIFAYCVVPTPVKTSQCSCTITRNGMWVHHLPTCWYQPQVSLSHRDTAGRYWSSFSHTHWPHLANNSNSWHLAASYLFHVF